MPVREFRGSLDPEPVVSRFTGNTDEEVAGARATLGDMAKSFGAGALQGTGSIFHGGGDVVARAINYLGEKVGYDPQIQAVNPLAGVADWLRSKITPPGRIAMEQSENEGDLPDPS